MTSLINKTITVLIRVGIGTFQFIFVPTIYQPIIIGNEITYTICNHKNICTNFVGNQYFRLVMVHTKF